MSCQSGPRWRLSSYSVLSDPLASGGYVLMNGISGALDLVEGPLGQMLSEALSSEHPREADPVVSRLDDATQQQWAERGHLTELSPEQERAIVVTIAEALHEEARRLPRFVIVPNLDCNYRCSYCFERPLQRMLEAESATDSPSSGRALMDHQQVRAAFDCITRIQQAAGHPGGGQIILYGGEPLDKANKDVVFEIARRGASRGFHFAAVTNGHDLDQFVELLGPGGIEQVQVTIDGPKRVHDRRRIHLGSESSFDKVMGNVQLALARSEAQIQIRANVDPGNIGLFDELLKIFAERGWLDHPQVVVYANIVYAKDAQGRVASKIESGYIARQLRARAARYFNVYTGAPDFHASVAMKPAFEEGTRFRLRATYCAANSGMYIFAPDECIYACWESLGKACSRIGHYNRSGELELDQAMTERWFRRSVGAVPHCQRCPYALVCGGGCAQYAEYNHGSLYQPYCDDFQRTFRSSLAGNADYFLRWREAKTKHRRSMGQAPKEEHHE